MFIIWVNFLFFYYILGAATTKFNSTGTSLPLAALTTTFLNTCSVKEKVEPTVDMIWSFNDHE